MDFKRGDIIAWSLSRNVKSSCSVSVAFRAGRRIYSGLGLCFEAEQVKSRGSNTGEGGINLLEFLCKVQLKALGLFV